MGAEWRIWQVQDQRFAEYRPDVLTFKSEPLTEDVTVSGKIVANIFASTSGTDSDWIVKFIDVYPDKFESEPSMSGFQLMIAGDVFRGRYYKGWEKSNPIPEKFVPNIFEATESDFQKATQRIYRSGKNASYIALPVISK